MAALATMKQLEERQVEHEVKLLAWSPKMDILAVGLFNGDVALYRINWQKIWTVSAPEGSACECFSWRPDGKNLAVGFSSGLVYILDIEKNVPVHTIDVAQGGRLSCVKWMMPSRQMVEESELFNSSDLRAQSPSDAAGDTWGFTKRLPALSKAYSYNPSGKEDLEDCQKLKDGGFCSLLVVGTDEGKICIYVNGFLHCAVISMSELQGFKDGHGGDGSLPRVVDVSLASDLSLFSAQYVMERADGRSDDANLLAFSLPLISDCQEELHLLSDKFGVVRGMQEYLEDTLSQISEAWEGMLLEMDSKLAGYMSKLPDDPYNGGSCGMAADFLELLAFGIPTPDLENFLLQEMTEKGLKKLGHSIEVSYSNVQRLVQRYLQAALQSLNFQLSELLGLVRSRSDRYEVVLGVTEANVVEVQARAAAIWCKSVELQQVIGESLRSFKAFFRWLYVEILRLSDEDVSEDLAKVSQQEIRYIAEFLENFVLESAAEEDSEDPENTTTTPKVGTMRPKHKCLERVGQYLKNQELSQKLDDDKASDGGNPWRKFLSENPEFLELPFIINVNPKSSLIQDFEALKAAIHRLFSSLNCDLNDKCLVAGCLHVPHLSGTSKTRCGQFECSSTNRIFGFVSCQTLLDDDHRLLLYQLERGQLKSGSSSLKALWLSFNKEDAESRERRKSGQQPPQLRDSSAAVVSLVDCQFYTSEVLSLLLSDSSAPSGSQRMIQLALSDVEVYFKAIVTGGLRQRTVLSCSDTAAALQTVNVFEAVGQASFRELERILAVQFAVSGLRKVAVFLFRNKRRVRIYDMEVDDEDGDDDEDEAEEENETLGTSELSGSEFNTSG